MADEKEELKMINHLLDVEKEANTLISQAMDEASKKIEAARAKYNEEYKQKTDELIGELKKKYDESVKKITDNHSQIIQKYEASLESKQQNYSQFKELLDKLVLENNQE